MQLVLLLLLLTAWTRTGKKEGRPDPGERKPRPTASVRPLRPGKTSPTGYIAQSHLRSAPKREAWTPLPRRTCVHSIAPDRPSRRPRRYGSVALTHPPPPRVWLAPKCIADLSTGVGVRHAKGCLRSGKTLPFSSPGCCVLACDALRPSCVLGATTTTTTLPFDESRTLPRCVR